MQEENWKELKGESLSFQNLKVPHFTWDFFFNLDFKISFFEKKEKQETSKQKADQEISSGA